MNKSALLASTALGLVLCIASVNAQQKGPDEKAAPQQKEQGQSGRNAEPSGKGAQGEAKEQPGKGGKGTAEKDKQSRGTAEKAEPKGKDTKGTAEKAEPKDKSTTRGSAEKAPQPQDKATKGAGAEPKNKSGSANQVQLTEEKRTNVGQTLGKETNLNRATNVNVSVNIGTRLPRSVRLVALPATIIAIVPEYRTYRYVVINDQVCIVEPNTFEIVEVIPVSGHTASRSGHAERLVLTEEERTIILREVDAGGGSTLGLGAIAEGADVPRDARVQAFPDVVVQKVPKVKGYKFFTAENRVAIVDPQSSKVQLVLEHRR